MDIALGILQPSDCPFGLANPDAAVTVDQLIVAVNNALHGCSFQVSESHPGVQVPGAFTLDQPNAYPNTIIVFLIAPPHAVQLVENVNYTVMPVQSTFEIRILTLPSEHVVPGTYDFSVSYLRAGGSFQLRTHTYGGNAG